MMSFILLISTCTIELKYFLFILFLFHCFCLYLTQGLIDLLALTATASACGILFYQVNKVAGYLFIPYLAWLGFASLLNYNVYKLNKDSAEVKSIESSKQS